MVIRDVRIVLVRGGGVVALLSSPNGKSKK